MSKRQMPDLSKLLSDTAVPMADALEPPPSAPRVIANAAAIGAPEAKDLSKMPAAARAVVGDEAATPNLENLNFKVPKSFRKRFRDCAYKADLKHNELLFAALEAWEAAQKGTK